VGFNTLLLINLALALVALLRLRPSLFIISVNLIVTLRSLANIAEFGQPTLQSYLPAALYSPENLSIAFNIFLIGTVMLAVTIALPGRRRPPQPLPGLPRSALIVLGIYFVAVIVSTRTILTHEYTDPDRIVFNFNLSGIHALLVGLVLYEVFRRVASGLLKPFSGVLLLFLLFLATDYLKGGTGFPTGALIGAVLLFLRFEPLRGRRFGMLIGSLAVLVLTAFLIRGVRVAVHSGGTQAVQEFADSALLKEESRAQSAEGSESIANGSQYAAHVLECISLYEAGVSRQWRSIYSPIEYTFKPSALVKALDLDRSEEAAWELARYYIHGGGVFVLGELYWNGGYFCLVIVFAGILFFSFCCDTRSRDSAFWFFAVCLFDVGLLQGFGYGFAQVSRGILNALIAYPVVLLLSRSKNKLLMIGPAPVARATS